MQLLTDDDVRDRLTPALAVSVARRCLIEAYQDVLSAPPRLRADLGAVDLVFTVGGYVDGPVGFRAYGTWPQETDQAVVVWGPDGSLLCCVLGRELGTLRTGALGGAAVDALARSDAVRVGVVGSGRQAWAQLWAVSAVRTPLAVRVFSPRAEHRERFAERADLELGVSAAAVSDARQAVRWADIVILATVSDRPVISADWIEPGAHVNTVGPKTRAAHETPPELVDAARVAVSDSPAQAAAYAEPFVTDRELQHLGAVLAGAEAGRRSEDDITLYCSTGLAGSEVAMALALTQTQEGVGE